jgi:hypothetical protein
MFATVAPSTSLALAGIIAGIYVRDIISYPGIKRLPAAQYARYHQELDREFARAMPIVGMSALLAGVANVAAPQNTPRRTLSAIALGCGLAEVGLTVGYNVPLNQTIQSWTAEVPPPDWADVRDRWIAGHRARTALSLIGLGCQIAAAMRR